MKKILFVLLVFSGLALMACGSLYEQEPVGVGKDEVLVAHCEFCPRHVSHMIGFFGKVGLPPGADLDTSLLHRHFVGAV